MTAYYLITASEKQVRKLFIYKLFQFQATQIRPTGLTTQTVRVVTPVNATNAVSVGTPTIVGGMQGPRHVTHRLVTVRFFPCSWRKAVFLFCFVFFYLFEVCFPSSIPFLYFYFFELQPHVFSLKTVP